MSKSVDLIGKNIDGCIKGVRINSEEVRKNMGLANEKGRSIGTLVDGLAEGVQKAAQLQQSAMKSSLSGFASVLNRVENSRKALYQRITALSQTALAASSKSSVGYATALKKRDDAIRKVIALPATSQNDQAGNQARVAASSANALAIQESRSWFGQYNVELKKTLRDYAHAQMEFSARALEQWSMFMEDLALLDFNRDTDEIVTLLEQGGNVQQAAAAGANGTQQQGAAQPSSAQENKPTQNV